MKSWLPGKKRWGARKQLGEGKRVFAYGKFSLSPHRVPALYYAEDSPEDQRIHMYTAYLVDVAEAFDKISQSR